MAWLTKIICLGIVSMPHLAAAAPVIEKDERMEINWAKHRVQFYGQAKPSGISLSEDYKTLEKRAWKDGMTYISKKAREIHIAAYEPLDFPPKRLAASADTAAQNITQSTMSINTIYYGEGGVRVILENSLVKIFESESLKFAQKEAGIPGATQYSGIILALDQQTPARAFYQVVDEEGKILFDYRFVAEDSYRKNLMGRWFRDPNPGELLEAAGLQPVTLSAQVVRDGVYKVTRSEWDQAILGHRGLLAMGMVTITIP